MFGKVKFIGSYAAGWLLLFALARLLFVLYQHGQVARASIGQVLLSFVYGLRMDLSMTAYLTLPVCLFVLLGLVIPFFRKVVVYRVYTVLLIVPVMLIVIADLEAYKNWNFRLDATPLKYLASPAEATASVSHLPLFWLGALLVILSAGAIAGFHFLLTNLQKFLSVPRYRLLSAVLILACSGLSVIAMRGGLQLAPMNQSAVYFSSENFANHAAINAPWNFTQGVLAFGETAHNPYRYMPVPRAEQIKDSLVASTFVPQAVFNTPQPNIILVIWESFTEKAVELKVEGKEVLPHFNRYRTDGLYFSNAYASGDRTDKGLSAILSGYPALPHTSILRDIKKAATLPFLSHLLQARGYTTPFYYGGELEFANIKSYLLQGGFSPLIQKRDFLKKDQNSKWGAHDGVIAMRLSHDLRQMKEPFFATWLTLTSHEPFETPVRPVFEAKDEAALFFSSLHYTDAVVNDFINRCKQQPWWQNTIIVIIGDHGHRLPEGGARSLNFRIPMLWMGGALAVKPGVYGRIVSQVDVAATLAAAIDPSQKIFPYSRNLFDTTSSALAFFSFNNGWGLVQQGGQLLFDNVGQQVIEDTGVITKQDLEIGKAMQQHIYQDFLNR